MRFIALQPDIVWENKSANHDLFLTMMQAAGIRPGDFVLLPELGDTGFSFNLDTIVDDQSLAWAKQAARNFSIWIQVGFARKVDADAARPPGRNCAAIVNPQGEVVGEYQKVHPFSYGKEADYFSGGDHLLIVDCDGLRIAPLICYDLRFPELWRLAALAGAEVFTIGASWPAARQHHWRSLLIARAIENQAWVVAVNRVGRDPHLQYVGGSIIVSPKGEVIAEGGDTETTLTAEIEGESVREWREQFPALQDIHQKLLGSIETELPKKTATTN